jgi:S1-C subfamily serine protease
VSDQRIVESGFVFRTSSDRSQKYGKTTVFRAILVAIGLWGSASVFAVQPPTVTAPPESSAQVSPGKIRINPTVGQDTSAAERSSQGRGTEIPVSTSLEGLFERGGIPDSLDQLRELEQQQRKVATRGEKCTVSVKIGPAQGCGVIITGTGFVVTAAHVAMRPGKTAIVTLDGGRQVTATTLGMNRQFDAGLIRINPDQNGGQPYPHASLGTSKDLLPGMWCVALGHPGGYDPGRGAVVRVGRLLEVRENVLVTDCALIGGDSGGPLFNLAGELVAVHSRIGNDFDANLHVPIDHYDDSWDRMASGESWGALPGFKPTLGVSGRKSDPQAVVIAVKPESPAAKAGLQEGDIVEEFGEKAIENFGDLKAAVADTMPGERIRVWIRRENRRIGLNVTIGRADE